MNIRRITILTFFAILTLSLIVFGMLKMLNKEVPLSKQPPEKIKAKQERYINQNGYISEGKKDSDVHVVVFIDYLCPTCRKYEQNIKKKLENKYISNRKIKYTEIPYPVVNKDSTKYASMARVIHKYGDIKTLQKYADKSFQSSTVDKDPLKTLERLDIDTDLKSKLTKEYKDNPPSANKSEINSKLGIAETPTIFVNGKHVSQGTLLEEVINQESEKYN
ncbi:DsbA family protein [Staphylococcus agnetis]|uniref:thioredoxin domain-containing protein n=1 Tax=Staphylococcus agnetis TaxID=985762 RepID=UPI00208F1C6A|nr:thioredoxin domain-containing protein [Staphylococcus agnetis]MCO4327871.1 DsbA family protein [Staphylococcus agnetis]